ATGTEARGRVRAHDPFGHVEEEAPTRVLALLCSRPERAVAPVVLVVRPVDKRVRPGERDLEPTVGTGGEEAVLVDVVRAVDRRLLDARRLRVVLVVERSHRAALLEAARMPDDVVVHLGSALLAVVDDVDPGALEQGEPVARRPVVDQAKLLLADLAAAEHLDELVSVVELERAAPALG